MTCHDKLGHLAVDKMLVLFLLSFDEQSQEWSWYHCLRFKQAPEQAPIETSYPMELVHMDSSMIGHDTGVNKDINILGIWVQDVKM